ncbi:MAG: prohibitin family protein [Firmicutes bacterium]|nr:prohibitin family protein [[Eubacterium] siraeum]MCM1486879.1 prohibitin family protein [Bacillota bacterium]
MAEVKFTTEKESGGKKVNHGRIAIIVIIAAFALIILLNAFSIVEEGYIGVKYRFGKIEQDNLTAGLNIHIPFIEEIVQVDTREQVYAISTDAYTSDTQSVKPIELKLNYCYDSTKLSDIIRNIGINNVETKLLVPNVQKIAKDAIGKVKAEQLVQSRADVTNEIQASLTEILAKDGIVVTAFAIENIYFDSAFEEAIQAKVIAEQDALKMENKTKEKEEEAKQVRIAAQAEADAKRISAEAEADAIEAIQEQLAKSPDYIDYFKMEKWDGKLPQVVSDGVNPFVALEGSGQTTAGAVQQAGQ